MATHFTNSTRYTRVAMWLHWLIAIAILYNLVSGLLGSLLPYWFFALHVSSGITILALTVLRIVWRLTHRPPPLLPMKSWEAKLAHTVHFLLYVGMVALPLSGWAFVSANPPAGSAGAAYAEAQSAATGAEPPHTAPTMIWNLFPLPRIRALNEIGRTPDGVAEQTALHDRIVTFHLIGGWIMALLLVLHIGGALKHQFVDTQPELRRMGLGHPGRRRS